MQQAPQQATSRCAKEALAGRYGVVAQKTQVCSEECPECSGAPDSQAVSVEVADYSCDRLLGDER